MERMGGFQPSAAYQASKAGIEGLAKHLAGRGGEHGLRVNVVRPGRILTDKWEGVLGEDGLFWPHYQNIQLLKRHGRAEDVAAAVAFLASDEAVSSPPPSSTSTAAPSRNSEELEGPC
jgi:NAD(P)-dependent dehydrogenase (short-subunit alcohol dehydrogenase family)